MQRKMLRAKIHKAVVTEANLNYVGSITIDENLLRATGILPNEFVFITNIDNGNRLETYVIKGEAGSGIVALNGAAARLVSEGDRIIIFSYFQMDESEIPGHMAKVIICDEKNRISMELDYPSSLDAPVPVV